mgnify:FL=1
MSYAILLLLYALDLSWLSAAFSYSFMVIIGNLIGSPINPSLDGRRAYVALILIACWFRYIYIDAYHTILWIENSVDISVADINEKAQRELLSLVTSIVNTLLVAGCKFKINGSKFSSQKKNLL